MKKRSHLTVSLCMTVLLLIAALTSVLTACNGGSGTLDTLRGEYGILAEGNFAEGAVLAATRIDGTSAEGEEILGAVAAAGHDKKSALSIFDVSVTVDGAEITPEGKVTVKIPLPPEDVSNYTVFCVENGTALALSPTVQDGMLVFEVESLSTFVIARAECTHESKNRYWELPPTFFAEGRMEYFECTDCGKLLDGDGNEVTEVTVPKLSSDLSLCINGVATPLVLEEQDESHIFWSLEGFSVAKGDVITLCQTGSPDMIYSYFSEGNVDKDGKILTAASDVSARLTATPNGLMLFIDGYQYEGIVVEINGVNYPMIYTSYPDETTTYIYGYVHFEIGDTFVIVDTVSGTVYDYDDLDEEYLWDTWDFHRGENGEFVIDYACRYGIEFDCGGNQEIYINKTFAPLDGSSYELTFENTDAASAELVQMQIETGSEAYEDLMWYYDHEDVVNKEDIVSYINAKGIYVYTVALELEEGTKFNVKNLTASSTIGADHLAEVYAESGSITKEGDYVKVLKSGSYSIVYLPCFNSFMIEKAEGSADVLMMLDGEFISLDKDSDGMVSYENFTAEFNTSITFLSGDGLSYYPIILDSETDSSLFRIYEANGISVVYFMKAGTYTLAYNVETGVLSVSGTVQEPDPSVTYYYYLALVDYTNGNRSDQLSPSASDPTVYRIDGVPIAKGSFLRITVLGSDGSDASYYTLKDTDAAIATEFAEMILFSKEGTYDILFDSVGKTVTLILAE